MALFSDAIAAKMAGRAIGVVPLVFFDFVGDPKRLWPGFGTITLGGYDWDGSGDLGSIDGLSTATSDAAQVVTFTLAGVTPEMQNIAKNSESLVRGQSVVVYAQFFDVTGDVPMAPLDSMLAIWSGVMDVMTFKATGPASRQITLTAEGENADRRRPRFGLMTDADQQARYPGDTALRFRPGLRLKTLRQPW
jgi:hypothetical protein